MHQHNYIHLFRMTEYKYKSSFFIELTIV